MGNCYDCFLVNRKEYQKLFLQQYDCYICKNLYDEDWMVVIYSVCGCINSNEVICMDCIDELLFIQCPICTMKHNYIEL